MDVLASYRVRPVVLPETLTRSDVGAAAWWSLLNDGVIRPLWGEVVVWRLTTTYCYRICYPQVKLDRRHPRLLDQLRPWSRTL